MRSYGADKGRRAEIQKQTLPLALVVIYKFKACKLTVFYPFFNRVVIRIQDRHLPKGKYRSAKKALFTLCQNLDKIRQKHKNGKKHGGNGCQYGCQLLLSLLLFFFSHKNHKDYTYKP